MVTSSFTTGLSLRGLGDVSFGWFVCSEVYRMYLCWFPSWRSKNWFRSHKETSCAFNNGKSQDLYYNPECSETCPGEEGGKKPHFSSSGITDKVPVHIQNCSHTFPTFWNTLPHSPLPAGTQTPEKQMLHPTCVNYICQERRGKARVEVFWYRRLLVKNPNFSKAVDKGYPKLKVCVWIRLLEPHTRVGPHSTFFNKIFFKNLWSKSTQACHFLELFFGSIVKLLQSQWSWVGDEQLLVEEQIPLEDMWKRYVRKSFVPSS